jgi:transcription antitermination factor NusG
MEKIARQGQVVDNFRPIFPGYIFIRPKNQFDLVLGISGILGFVKFDGTVTDVSEVVETLELESCGTNVISRCGTEIVESRFMRGDKIRLTEGVASGCTGFYHQAVNRDRAIVMMSWMGRLVPLTVKMDAIEIEGERKRRRHRSRRQIREDNHQAPVQLC